LNVPVLDITVGVAVGVTVGVAVGGGTVGVAVGVTVGVAVGVAASVTVVWPVSLRLPLANVLTGTLHAHVVCVVVYDDRVQMSLTTDEDVNL
jgi:hypothetical protein